MYVQQLLISRMIIITGKLTEISVDDRSVVRYSYEKTFILLPKPQGKV